MFMAAVGWLRSSKLARIALAIGVVLLLLWLIAFLVDRYGDARFDAGKAEERRAWEIAAEKLEEQSRTAADAAEAAAILREAEYADRLATEKEKIDAAIASGDSPLDALFPGGV